MKFLALIFALALPFSSHAALTDFKFRVRTGDGPFVATTIRRVPMSFAAGPDWSCVVSGYDDVGLRGESAEILTLTCALNASPDVKVKTELTRQGRRWSSVDLELGSKGRDVLAGISGGLQAP